MKQQPDSICQLHCEGKAEILVREAGEFGEFVKGT